MGLKKLKELFTGKPTKSKKKKLKVVSPASEKAECKKTKEVEHFDKNNMADKQAIAQYQKKIAEILKNDPGAQKRAAMILSELVKKTSKK